jgi:gliding motility associated protien GldN
MKTRVLIVAVVLCCLSGSLLAQNVLDGVYVKETTLSRTALPYAYLREADVMWNKRIWRVIDLKEKINLPFAYPVSKSIRDRRSLIDVIMDAAEEGSLTLYNQSDDEFTIPLTSEDMKKLGGAGSDTVTLTRPDPPYDTYDTVITRVFSRDKVIAYRIKEDWFFDKQRSVIEARIIGFAPMIYAVDQYGNIREGNIKVPLFWVYYPEARQMLANAEVFNRENDAERRSYDDLFQKRMFSSYVMKESNVYDRRIDDYAQGINALLESERIKTEIVNTEHDLWEY